MATDSEDAGDEIDPLERASARLFGRADTELTQAIRQGITAGLGDFESIPLSSTPAGPDR